MTANMDACLLVRMNSPELNTDTLNGGAVFAGDVVMGEEKNTDE